tara:strand:+ start:180 stop:362 length:183 start_codon:yes stop_codon:yes gene_type:complete
MNTILLEEDLIDCPKEDKQHWQIEEDLLICIFVQKFSIRKWNILADELRNRVDGSNRNGK